MSFRGWRTTWSGSVFRWGPRSTSGESLAFAYFPTTCIFSLIATAEDGSTIEVAMTGRNGMVGIALVLGGETTHYRIVVQCAGDAYRVRAEVLCWELDQGGSLRRLALTYTQALLAQIAQNVLCNRLHSIDQQLCRWLLSSLDMRSGTEFDITQEAIANLLGCAGRASPRPPGGSRRQA
jgi:hypothetical protein